VNIGCTARNVSLEKNGYLINKEKEILEKVSNEIIVQNTDFINKRKEWKCTQPLFLHINQQKEKTNGFKYYIAFFSESGLYEECLPTHLWNNHGVHIAVYLDNGEVLSKSEIPENLFEDYDECFRNESSWLILICNDTYKTNVIDMGLIPHIAVKQFQDFSCDVEDSGNGQIKIEDAIVDTDLMETIMESLPR
jgi:hypothetical protein